MEISDNFLAPDVTNFNWVLNQVFTGKLKMNTIAGDEQHIAIRIQLHYFSFHDPRRAGLAGPVDVGRSKGERRVFSDQLCRIRHEINYPVKSRFLGGCFILLHLFFCAVHAQLSHFAIKIAPVQSQAFGGIGHIAAGHVDLLFNKLYLKFFGGVAEIQIQ